MRIPPDKVGIIDRIYGPQHPDDKHKVRVHGSPGIQASILRPEERIYRMKFVYRIDLKPVTKVPTGTIGVVIAHVGAVMPSNQVLARSVECDYFQDGEKFLLNGGQMGRQPDVLGAGTYYINPYIFEVLTVDTIGAGKDGLTVGDLREISIHEGSTGVVVALEGLPSGDDDQALGGKIPGHHSFQDATAFLDGGGQHGAQEETLGPGGVYRINPWFARVVVIPTRDLILEWSNRASKQASRFDAALDQITVNIEGYQLHCTMSQTIRIPPQSAPKLVQRFGEIGAMSSAYGIDETASIAPVQRFVEKVLGAAAEGYFLSTANRYKIEKFYEKSEEVRLELEDKIRNALADWNVLAVRTTLKEFVVPEHDDINARRRKIADERVRRQELIHEDENAKIEATIERRKIDTEAERQKLEVVAEVELLAKKLVLLGRDNVATQLFLEQISNMNVPEFVGGDAQALLQYMPLPVALKLADRAMGTFGTQEKKPILADKPDEHGDLPQEPTA